MPQNIDVTPLGPGEFAASITEGENTTQHRVLRAAELLDQLGAVDVDQFSLVLVALRVLLEEVPATALPHEIDLLKPPMDDVRFDDELTRRLR